MTMIGLMKLSRRTTEMANKYVTRFEEVVERADHHGQLPTSTQGLAWILLYHCGVNENQLVA